jgi:Cysteine-rich secretory protein family
MLVPTLTRRTRVLAIASVSSVLFGAAFVGPLAEQASASSSLVGLVNSARASAGLHAYSVDSQLTSLAQAHAEAMAAKQSLYHNPSLASDVTNWKWVGENVGYASSVAAVENAFMHSPPHRSNILDTNYTEIGVGIATDKNGTVWVTEDFKEPMTSSASSSSSHKATTKKPAKKVVKHVVKKPSTNVVSKPVVKAVVSTPKPSAAVTPSPSPTLSERLVSVQEQWSGGTSTNLQDPVATALAYAAMMQQVAQG